MNPNQLPFVFSDFQRRSAVISPCGHYRYALARNWNPDLPKVLFLMLNPSTADANNDDPTLRRCIGFAKYWQCGGLLVGNLFALRTPYPNKLYEVADPVGPENDAYLTQLIGSVDEVVCAWGNNGTYKSRGREVLKMVGDKAHYLETTQFGEPCHPLYLSKLLVPKTFHFHPE